MSVDFSQIIQNFLTAELGEDVRGSLVAIAQALQDAINAQLLTVTSDLTDDDPNTAPQAGVVGALFAKAFINRGLLPTTVTKLSTVTEYGSYGVDAENYDVLEDLPDNFGSVSSASSLHIYAISSTVFFQLLIHHASGRVWWRTFEEDGAASDLLWKDLNDTMLKDYAKANGLLPITVTDLTDAVRFGWYGLISQNYGVLQDLPEDFPTGNAPSVLRNESLSNTAKLQTIVYLGNGRTWTRRIEGETVTAWSVINSGVKKCYIRLLTEPSLTAVQRLYIYLPTCGGYMEYQLYHYDDDSNNCNGWQINYIRFVDEAFHNADTLTAAGEWECAVKLEGRDDFSGGHTHGDEQMTDAVLFIEDIETEISAQKIPSVAGAMAFERLRFVQKSIFYDPADSETEIAEHEKEYIFTADGLTLNQTVKWKVEENLSNCYMAMMLPLKTKTDSCYTDKGIEYPLAADNFSFSVNGAKIAGVRGKNNGLCFEMSTPIYPSGLTGGDRAYFTDNTDKPYNKAYFVVCTGGSSTVGETWASRTIYKITKEAVANEN